MSMDHTKPLIVPAGADALGQIGKNVYLNVTVSVCACIYMCVPTPVRHGTASCELLVLPQEDFPAMTPST